MKKIVIPVAIVIAVLMIAAIILSKMNSAPGYHVHEDGSTHYETTYHVHDNGETHYEEH